MRGRGRGGRRGGGRREADQNIMCERLVSPCVMKGRGKVNSTIQDHKQRPSEAETVLCSIMQAQHCACSY